ncbi:MAG: carbohydrate kinase family protein [Clostridia bacterium]|nr:carbohydrate kinase family protein [Clostridia bacterium]
MAFRYDLLCVGLQVIDLLVTGADASIFERETTNVGNIQLLLGGDALNQAVTASMLGARTALMGSVGNDHLGEVLLSQLGNYPISVFDRKIDAKTGISVVLCRPDGERHFVLQTGHNEHFCYGHVDEEAVKSSAIVSIGSCMSLKGFDGEDTVRLFDLAHSAGGRTALDFKINRSEYDMPAILESIRRADYVLPSEADVAKLTGEAGDPAKMAQGMRDLGAKNIVLKLGGRGCYLSAEGIEKHIPACPANCIDTTGAGDSFVAAFLHGVAQGWDVESCARFANAAGSIAVEHPGANGMIRSEAQVLARMRGE